MLDPHCHLFFSPNALVEEGRRSGNVVPKGGGGGVECDGSRR